MTRIREWGKRYWREKGLLSLSPGFYSWGMVGMAILNCLQQSLTAMSDPECYPSIAQRKIDMYRIQSLLSDIINYMI